MKAVFGNEIVRSRAIDNSEEEFEFSENTPPEFRPVILRIYQTMEPRVAAVVPTTQCFGYMWKDEEGICPESACALRNQCSQVYEEVTTKPVEVALPPPAPVVVVPPPPPLVRSIPAVSSPVKPRRGKFKGTTKYTRWGYQDGGRPVDHMIRALTIALGEPKELPKNWSHAQFDNGLYAAHRITVSKTASYHMFMIDGKTVLRFWTNAAAIAIVDLHPVLVILEKSLGRDVTPVPKTMAKKLAPCTGRMHCASTDEAEHLAAVVLDMYKIKPPQKRRS